MTQAQALAIMKTGVNIYLTGSAGSGKTYLLNQYISYLKDHDIPVAVTASTGIAATHMNGMTIHGWSGIGIRETLSEQDLEALEDKPYLWKRFEKARVLIIDEVSMLHAHRLDMVDRVCRKFKRSDAPFGGLQVILSGDFFQLPPINKTMNGEDARDMVVYSEAWKAMNPAVCYLSEQHRQEDPILTDILNTIRNDSISEKEYGILEECLGRDLPAGQKATKLYTHNANVDTENMHELGTIAGDEKIYKMTHTGNPVLVEILKKSCLAHEELRLKIGAEVMCIKNNFEEGYVNGTRGIVKGFQELTYTPIIKLYNGKVIYATPETWAIEEDGKAKASINQIPLRLAWAITIHKSQGMSLDNAEIDLSRAFAYGMGYVALSRVRTLSGIKLLGFSPDALKVNPKVLEFDQDLRNQSTQNELLFGKLKKGEQEKLEYEFIARMGGVIDTKDKSNRKNEKSEKVPTIMITKKLLDKGKSIKEIAKERDLTLGTITHHIEQIMESHPETDITHIKPSQKNIDIVRKINQTLKGEEAGKLSPIKTALEKERIKMTFEDIRLARLFI